MIGRSWAIVRGRMTGNREKAQGILDSMSPIKRREINRQESQTRNRLKKTAYKLGERRRARK